MAYLLLIHKKGWWSIDLDKHFIRSSNNLDIESIEELIEIFIDFDKWEEKMDTIIFILKN